MTRPVQFAGANEVQVLKLTTVGLGNYDRSSGYKAGDITAKWETMQLTCERGRAFSLDRMDNEETLGLVLGNLIREWMRVHVAPELDAYRFAAYSPGHPGETLLIADEWGQRDSRNADRGATLLPLRTDVVGVRLDIAPADIIECNVPPFEPEFAIDLLRLEG